MASSSCWKCLSRPAIPIQLASPLPRIAGPAFSTSSSLSFPAPKAAKKGVALTTKGTKTLRIKKKAPPVKTGRPPAEGERKAMRKRIVLSNTNALEVPGLQDLSPELVASITSTQEERDQRQKDLDAKVVDDIASTENDLNQLLGVEAPVVRDMNVVGRVVGLAGPTIDSLRASEAFKSTQGWGLFRRPGLLIRKESVTMSSKLVQAQDKKSAVRMVVEGPRGTGKSLMLLHAMATAFVKGWIVLNIPEAQEVTNAVNDYAPIPRTTPTLWTQNTYTATWLSQIAKANDAVLSRFKVKIDHNLPIPIPADTTLTRLCELGARDPDVAWPVFQAFWAEITREGLPPVMMCLDSLSYVMQDSLYRAPDFSLIHSHDLTIVKHFMDHLSGSAPLPNGGAILAATNRSHGPVSKSMNLCITQAWDKQNGMEITPRDPFERKYDVKAEAALKDVEVMKLEGLSKKEARGLMEYWAQSGVLRSRVDEETVAERWALAGNGIIGEIGRGALWMRI